LPFINIKLYSAIDKKHLRYDEFNSLGDAKEILDFMDNTISRVKKQLENQKDGYQFPDNKGS
jgi:hypothetical protein